MLIRKFGPGDRANPYLAVEKTKANFLARMTKRWSDREFMLNAYQEQAARRGVFIDALAREKGVTWAGLQYNSEKLLRRLFDEGVTEAEAAAALKSVNKVLGDYETFLPFEQAILRRYLIPFW